MGKFYAKKGCCQNTNLTKISRNNWCFMRKGEGKKINQVMTWVSFAVEGIFRLKFAVWEKTEEDALGSEVATTFDGFSRRFVFSCYMNFSFHKTETTDAHLSSPIAKVFPFIEFLGDKSYYLFECLVRFRLKDRRKLKQQTHIFYLPVPKIFRL